MTLLIFWSLIYRHANREAHAQLTIHLSTKWMHYSVLYFKYTDHRAGRKLQHYFSLTQNIRVTGSRSQGGHKSKWRSQVQMEVGG